MALIRNAANMIRKGRVGETTYYVSGGQQIARQARNDSNFGDSARRSEAQQSRRVLWANLVNFYKASMSWMPKAFETKKRNQSDYNKFMQVNIGSSKIALTKTEAAEGACVASNFIVSQGSLPTVEIVQLENSWRTNLALGDLSISDSTTVAEFTRALVANNAHIIEGMQVSFASYQQTVDALGTPRLISRLYEVTLDTKSSIPVRAHLPVFCSSSVDGYLGTNDAISIGGFAFILSSLQNGRLLVSTQQLVTNNEELISEYSSDVQMKLAITSYGVNTEVILSPTGTVTQEPEAQPVYITSWTVDGKTYMPGQYYGPMKNLSGMSLQIMLSSAKVTTVTSVFFYDNQNNRAGVSTKSISGRVITAAASTITSQAPLARIEVNTGSGEVYTIAVGTDSGSGDLT